MVAPSRQCGRGGWERCDGAVGQAPSTCWSAGYSAVAAAVRRSTATPQTVHRISPVGPQMVTVRTELYRNLLTERGRGAGAGRVQRSAQGHRTSRSEEHTSELQSQSNL